MNTSLKILMTVVLALQTAWLTAATMPGSIRRDYLAQSESLDRLSIGLGYEDIQREIEWKDSKREDILDASSGNFLIGFDVHPAVTIFATFGAAALNDADSDTTADSSFKWSAGLAVNIWSFDLKNPEWMSGALTIKAVGEYASYESEGLWSDDTLEWSDARLALPFGYEMFEDISPLENSNLRMSLNLYVGPAVSMLKGQGQEDSVSSDFEGRSSAGVVAGLDLFLAANLSLGVGVEIFDETTMDASIRYHF